MRGQTAGIINIILLFCAKVVSIVLSVGKQQRVCSKAYCLQF